MFVSISTYRKTEKFAILGKDKNNGLLFKHTALRYDGYLLPFHCVTKKIRYLC